MRTINATLTTNQKNLHGRPYHEVVIGTSPNTVDVSADLLAYTYDERAGQPGKHQIVLDNAAGTYNSLTGDYAYIAHGAEVEINRGLSIAGTDYSAELPTLWIESLEYSYGSGRSLYIINCIDMWELLYLFRYTSTQTWSSVQVSEVLDDILGEVGLARTESGAVGSTISVTVEPTERAYAAIQRLHTIWNRTLYFNLDGEFKERNLFLEDSSIYDFSWNAEHHILACHRSADVAWEVNSVTVNGAGSATATRSSAAQIAKVGTRAYTVHYPSLTTNGQCDDAAKNILATFQTDAAQTVILCRPCHGLEAYDTVTLKDPPWGGSDVEARVVAIKETYSTIGSRSRATWQQLITLGHPAGNANRSDRDGGKLIDLNPQNIKTVADLGHVSKRTGKLDVDGHLKFVADGELAAGQTAYDTGSGLWIEDNSGTPRLSLGDSSGERLLWDGSNLSITAALKSYANETEYSVYGLVPLATPLTSEDWDGDSKTTGDNGTIDLSSAFSAPAGIVAALLSVYVEDETPGVEVRIGPSSSYKDCLLAATQVANQYVAACGLVPCDGSGDVYIEFSGEVDAIDLKIWGYCI